MDLPLHAATSNVDDQKNVSAATDSNLVTLKMILAASPNHKIMSYLLNYASTTYYYQYMLNTMKGYYLLLAPTDECFTTMIDPIGYGQSVPQAGIQFVLRNNYSVNAVLRKFDKSLSPVVFSDSIGVITDMTFLKNRFKRFFENHLIVKDADSNRPFLVTKGNDLLRFSGFNTGDSIQGGFEVSATKSVHITGTEKALNGMVLFTDKILQTNLKSVYTTLAGIPEFSMFYQLMVGIPDTCVSKIFVKQGVDYRIGLTHSYHYTLYVPTNQAIQAAMDQGLIQNWSSIVAITDKAEQAAEMQKIIRLVRYHFQDNAVFYGQTSQGVYRCNTLKTNDANSLYATGKNRFYQLEVRADAGSMNLTTETGKKANVLTDKGLYNLIATDYEFSKLPTAYKNVDGTGLTTASNYNTSSIVSTSSVVIHQIDQVLTFQ